MMQFRDIPIQQKLVRVILITCSIALVLMASSYIIFEYYNSRKVEKNKVSSLAQVVASNSSAALAFQSPEDAIEILNALRADKNIKAACIYDVNGKVFARYPHNLDVRKLPAKPAKHTFTFRVDFIEGFQPIEQKGLLLGTLYISSSLKSLNAQVKFNIGVALMLVALTLCVGYFLSVYLQKTISDPIISLEKAARMVSIEGDYSIRVPKSGNDEIGTLTAAFNHMLGEIEAQNRQLTQASLESAKLAAIVQSSGDAIIGCSLDLTITSWNKSAERIFGYTAEEMVGQPVSSILVAEPKSAASLWENSKYEEAATFETRCYGKGKNIIDVSLSISLIKNPQGEVIGLSHIARDITEQKITERKITEHEEHLRLATQSAELGTFDMDLIKDTMIWDRRCRELFGIYHDRPVSYHEHFLNGLHEEDRDRISKIIETAFDKKLSNGNYDVEYRTVGELDKKLRWVKAKGKVFFDEEDKPVRFIGSVLDITRQKQDELRKNDFIAIISHELKTPLTTIKSYVQILLGKAKKASDEFSINALTRADSQTTKMASMIKDFLNLARIEEGKLKLELEVFDLTELLADVVAEAKLLVNSHPIEVNFCPWVKVTADKDKLSQVLINLISNASKYSPSGSTITVGCEQKEDMVKIFVKDEGHGISPADQKKLFTRFHRVENDKTKTVSGFGIGLYIVSEILKYHNSKIAVDSSEGAGSTFYFYLGMVN